MKRRQFLRGVGAAAAGAAIGLRATRARADGAVYSLQYDQARAVGRPLLLGTFDSWDDRRSFVSAQETLRDKADREVALRVLLVEFASTLDPLTLAALTGMRVRTRPPSLALLDGDRPRLVKVAKLDSVSIMAGVERFLLAAIPLDAAWLAPRAAALSRKQPELASQVRDRIAAGQPTRELGRRAAPIVVLEALRRKGADRQQLLDGLLEPEPPKPDLLDPPKPQNVEKMCGIVVQLLDPLGARFANAYTRQSHGRRRNHVTT